MNFFESQDLARRRSGRLVFLFIIAVALMIVAIYAVVLGVIIVGDAEPVFPERGWWRPEIFAIVAVVTLLIIGLGSLYRVMQLRGGGGAVARMMGAKQINPNTQDPDERRLVNIVEEMSLASGIPVPEIFMMDENSINAFAAGYSSSDAAVAVTRGAATRLSRDELQGVVAHEFSHILNGDMRLNIRLIGLLNGIFLIHLIGNILVESLQWSRFGAGTSRRGNSGGGIIAAIFAIGAALMAIGYIGVLFGRVIQSAVSRQREYLADAAAVQFTRNPGGIAGALKKIGGIKHGAKLRAAHSLECSHMFFANAISASLSNIFATHPPLPRRIHAIEPQWDGKFVTPPPVPNRAATFTRSPQAQADAGLGSSAFAGTGASGRNIAMSPDVLLATIGALDQSQMPRAERLLNGIPHEVRETAREPFGAEAVIFGLLLDADPGCRRRQLDIVRANHGEPAAREADKNFRLITPLGPDYRLPLIDLAIPALRNLSAEQFATFHHTITAMIESDNRLSLFEFTLGKSLLRHLTTLFNERPPPPVRIYSILGLANELSLLLSALAHVGEKDTTRAFSSGALRMGDLASNLRLLPEEECTFEAIDKALDRFRVASFPVRKQLLDAAVFVIASDWKIAADEAELLRAIADCIDCPMPPLA